MKIRNQTASSYFFGNTSLEFVYYEAIANAIDAGADKIDINIELPKLQEQKDLIITISDNGKGFDESNFDRFCHVLDKQDESHKGLGRLVYLNYFNKVVVTSCYGEKCRDFVFDDNFEDSSNEKPTNDEERGTKLVFSGYRKEKIKEYSYVVPDLLIDSILEHFLPKFYQMKMDKTPLIIEVSLDVTEENLQYGFRNTSKKLDVSKLSELKSKEIPDEESLFTNFQLRYSIEHDYESRTIITAICADGRTLPIPIVTNKQFPIGYKMIFILYSDYFNGKSNISRERLELDEDDEMLQKVKKIFSKLVSEIISIEAPEIMKENEKTAKQIHDQYPYLTGYIKKDTVGLVDKTTVVSEAQAKYFSDQRQILEATSVDEEQYEMSLEYSSRILTQYIIYREKILSRLKAITNTDDESTIHNLIVPPKRIFSRKSKIEDIFVNNAWVIDDRFMSYTKILSDREMEELFAEIGAEGKHIYSDPESGRPDIAVIFSKDPSISDNVDVVVIELKKLGLELAKKEEVYSQLKQRARRLLEFYPKKIQRLWFYGIIDFSPEFRASLIESGFTRLFSTGELFYRRQEIVMNPDTLEKEYADLFLLSYETMLEDATARNATFLEILKESIKEANSLKE
jgi:hypothetical protein